MYTMRICILLFLSITFTSCWETHPDRDRPVGFVTEILRVEAVPNPVAVGDTLWLKCVIKDSLKTGFKYSWFNGVGRVYTDVPNLKLIIDHAPGKYDFIVKVYGNDPAHFDPSKQFEINVIDKE